MILQALHDLYQRLADDHTAGLPKPGYSLQNITFRVVIRPDGSLVEIQPVFSEEVTIDKKGKEKRKRRPTPLLVPGAAKASGQGLNPGFLWDNTGYLLGYKPEDAAADRTRASHDAFTRRHLELEDSIQDEEFSAVCRFLEGWNPVAADDQPSLGQISNGFGVFQLAGRTHHVHESEKVAEWWNSQPADSTQAENGFCLVTGNEGPLAQLHDPAIKGVSGAQSSGAKLVSFNLASFDSYAKEQSYNAPVSESAAFAYCCALNYLLAQPRRRFRIGDATTVFWTEKPTTAEVLLPCMMDLARKPEEAGLKQRLADILEKLGRGQLSEDDLGDAGTRFYILGLAPNASRLSVRFWHTGTLGELAANLQKHFNHGSCPD